MRFYLMLNNYRTSTDDGFANTWRPVLCRSRRDQAAILRHGLPVDDRWYSDNTPYLSTNGIRLCTPAERQQIYRGVWYIDPEIHVVTPQAEA